ncbi:hypothetical protein A2160_02695 [Candidatus Beckwithbacteria bacterium RBG_13_42_9]|uniref:DUF6311 domain-containing protein n=1 Tax=Candidatus Beckwithbacteria bacterium RBG_13_42_9 TaxID=1797457 RepID=A0A1F5E7M2_9BACT|nr:MAG: hypothetical protein A2160_02695 [Candidatus Beckwithbacteria bacterium RBG_13_42_9]
MFSKLFSQNLICAFFVTFIFSFRWATVLPFSGYMPVITSYDALGYFGRYLIYAKEPLGFPLGTIKNLSFPFQSANITRGSMALFGLVFKLLSKVYPPLAEFYYFPLVEILAVFLSGYFSCLLLLEFKVKSFWLRFLGAVLVSLSFPLLFRSSAYYQATIHVLYFPLYLAFTLFYIRLQKSFAWKDLISLVAVIIVATLIEYYIFLGLFILFGVLLSFSFFNFIIKKNQIHRRILISTCLAFILGICFSFFTLSLFGNQSNLKIGPNDQALMGRYSPENGYGGGFGGGFHVADVLTFFIPPQDNQSIPLWKKAGPTTYLTKLGFPLSTNNLQNGQYEGFTYLGTITIGLIVFLILLNLVFFFKNFKLSLTKLRLRFTSVLLLSLQPFSLSLMIGIATFLLFILSLGYIIHFGGTRFNNIPTPALILAVLWPKFMFARSLGRFAIPLMLFITLGMIVYLNKFLHSLIYGACLSKKALLALMIILLIAVHISEVRGYLQPPVATRGNEIANLFGSRDQQLIISSLHDKKALMIVPAFTGKLEWGKIVYSLAFYSKIPISGATIGSPGELASDLEQYSLDIREIMAGNIKEIVARYGDVAIAAPQKIAENILSKSDLSLKSQKLNDQDVTILTLDKEKL